MYTPSSRRRSFALGLCLALGFLLSLGIAADRKATEKIPPDKVIHPLLKGVSNPVLIPESQKEPVYPEKWRGHRLGGKVILQGVVKKSGTVEEITALVTNVWVETDCATESVDASGKRSGDPEIKAPAGSEGSGSGEQAAPPEAHRDFEAAAIEAVKRWKYRPGNMNGVPVDVFYTIIVKFTSCPTDPGKGTSTPR